MSECCKSGFNWNGSPVGREEKIAGLNTYVAGDNKEAAILIVHDIFGWTFSNLRVLADHYAKEANATVYLPDFFGGEVVSPEALDDEEARKKFDLMAFIGRNGKDKRYPEIKAAAEALKKDYKKVGAIGFCYGGWAVFQLGAKSNNGALVDAISTAHPSLLTTEEVDEIAVPVQVLSPEHDPLYTEELKAYTTSKIPTLGVEFDYQYFPALAHGFATRGDQNDVVQKKGLERAKNAVTQWFGHHLHE